MSSRPVYSTGTGRLCPRCGWPAADCRCAANVAHDEAVPTTVCAKLRLETRGRAGKSVTVIDGLPRNAKFVDTLARDLKKALATGGTALERAIEIHGDRREQLRTLLAARGMRVKG